MTTENNKIIAEFMRLSKNLHLYESPISGKYIEDLKYHSSWNWLMGVVEKIESLKSPYDGFSWSIEPFSVIINRNSVYVQVDAGKSDDISFPDIHCKTKIEMVYNTCIEFIKWHNEQNK